MRRTWVVEEWMVFMAVPWTDESEARRGTLRHVWDSGEMAPNVTRWVNQTQVAMDNGLPAVASAQAGTMPLTAHPGPSGNSPFVFLQDRGDVRNGEAEEELSSTVVRILIPAI